MLEEGSEMVADELSKKVSRKRPSRKLTKTKRKQKLVKEPLVTEQEAAEAIELQARKEIVDIEQKMAEYVEAEMVENTPSRLSEKAKYRMAQLEKNIFGSSHQALAAMGVEIDTSSESEFEDMPVVYNPVENPGMKLLDIRPRPTADHSDDSTEAVGSDTEENKEKPARKAVWVDEDDEDAFKATPFPTRAYLATAGPRNVETLTAAQLKERREKNFESVMGDTPDWANLDKQGMTRSDDEDEDTKYLMTRTGDVVNKKSGLTSTVLAHSLMEPANVAQKHKASCIAVQFHKNSQVVMTAGMDHCISFFQVDGKHNELIKSEKVDKQFRMSQASLCGLRNEVVLTASRRLDVLIYDMLSGEFRSVPNLLRNVEHHALLNKFVLSPDGQYMVVLGSSGYLHVIARSSMTFLYSVRMNVEVTSACFSADSQNLFTFGDAGDVYVWDVRKAGRRINCAHKFADLGSATGGSSITVHNSAQYLACGSNSGFVNLYNLKDALHSPKPLPVKAFGNLLTTVDTLLFNGTGELLLSGSSETDSAARLANVASRTVFQNFFTVGHPTHADFSPNSGYLSVATMEGWAKLYRLHSYDAY